MPYSVDINDVILHRRGLEADDFARQIRDYFDTLYEEGAEQGRVMCIALHPYWVGQPHRIRVFRRAMEYILSHPGVWLTTAGEITDWFNTHHLPLIESFLRGRRPMAEPINTLPVGEQRRPGMDHRHHAYRTLTEAPRFASPDAARIAFTVTLMLDYWEVNPPNDANQDPRVISPLGKFFPDWLTWSHAEPRTRHSAPSSACSMCWIGSV